MTEHTRTLMQKLTLHYFGQLMGSIDSLEKKKQNKTKKTALMLGKIDGRKRGQQGMR